MRVRLTVAYDGTAFHGWQEQNPPDGPPLRTVQRTLRQAIQQVVREPIQVVGASRTDTGVHAAGQSACFDTSCPIPVENLPRAITGRLPPDVEARHAEQVGDDFDVIGDVTRKQYRFVIWNTPRRPLARRHTVFHFHDVLDEHAMADAAARLVGEHDFAAFTNAGHGRETTVREIFACGVSRAVDQPEVTITVSGSGFLYNMVRILAGCLVEVGRGHWSPDHIDTLLREGDRQRSGPTLPPQGLCLQWVRYG